MLALVPTDHLSNLIALLKTERATTTRTILRKLITHYTMTRATYVIQRMGEAESGVARDLLAALAEAVPERAVEAVEAVAATADTELQYEMLRVLDDVAYTTRVRAVLMGPDQGPPSRTSGCVPSPSSSRKETPTCSGTSSSTSRARATNHLQPAEADLIGRALPELNPKSAQRMLSEWNPSPGAAQAVRRGPRPEDAAVDRGLRDRPAARRQEREADPLAGEPGRRRPPQALHAGAVCPPPRGDPECLTIRTSSSRKSSSAVPSSAPGWGRTAILRAGSRDRGERFVRILFGLLRMTNIHSLDNNAFTKPMREIGTVVSELMDTLGAVHLVTVEDQVFVNDIRLRMGRDEGGGLGAEIRRHGVGGISFHAAPTEAQMRVFVELFSSSPEGGSPRLRMMEQFSARGYDTLDLFGVYRFRISGEEDGKPVKRNIKKISARASELIDESWDNLSAERLPNPLPMRRIVTEILDSDDGRDGLLAEEGRGVELWRSHPPGLPARPAACPGRRAVG